MTADLVNRNKQFSAVPFFVEIKQILVSAMYQSWERSKRIGLSSLIWDRFRTKLRQDVVPMT